MGAHRRCECCRGPAAWYARYCWRCKEAALADAEHQAERAAAAVSKTFRDALHSQNLDAQK